MKVVYPMLFMMWLVSETAFALPDCSEVQNQFDQIHADYFGDGESWAHVRELLGDPTDTIAADGRVSSLLYQFEGCRAEFALDEGGRISRKAFVLEAIPLGNVRSADQTASRAPDLEETIAELDRTVRALLERIDALERRLASSLPVPSASVSPSARQILSDEQIRQVVVNQSIVNYSGACPCPYSLDGAGDECGERSAYRQTGGAAPMCYSGDVPQTVLDEYRARQAAR